MSKQSILLFWFRGATSAAGLYENSGKFKMGQRLGIRRRKVGDGEQKRYGEQIYLNGLPFFFYPIFR